MLRLYFSWHYLNELKNEDTKTLYGCVAMHDASIK